MFILNARVCIFYDVCIVVVMWAAAGPSLCFSILYWEQIACKSTLPACVSFYVCFIKALWWRFSWTVWNKTRRNPRGGLCSWTVSSPVWWSPSASPMENPPAMTPWSILGSVTIAVFKHQRQTDWKLSKYFISASLYPGWKRYVACHLINNDNKSYFFYPQKTRVATKE